MPRAPHRQPSRWHLATSSLRSLPHYIIPGAQKCGTTAMQDYLIQHPLVLPPLTKEINFFSDKRLFDRGPGWYRSNFPLRMELNRRSGKAGAKVRTGEATPKYLFYPGAVERMAEVIPRAKLIVMLRDPVERAYSQYQMHHRQRAFAPLPSWEHTVEAELSVLQSDDATLSEAARGAFSRGGSDLGICVQYLARGLYFFQLERLLKLFPREQVLVLFLEDLRSKLPETYGRVLSFLELPPFELSDAQPKNTGAYPSMDPGIRDALERFFHPFNRRLEEFLDQPIPWL